jgi:hypothetical protein
MTEEAPPRISPMRLAARETYFYWMFGTLMTSVVLIAPLALASPVILIWGLHGYLHFALRTASFVLLLLVCGMPANVWFVALLRGRLYEPADPTVDWLPWLPWAEWTVGTRSGGRYLRNGSPLVWLAWWAVFAVPTWGVALLAYGKLFGVW